MSDHLPRGRPGPARMSANDEAKAEVGGLCTLPR